MTSKIFHYVKHSIFVTMLVIFLPNLTTWAQTYSFPVGEISGSFIRNTKMTLDLTSAKIKVTRTLSSLEAGILDSTTLLESEIGEIYPENGVVYVEDPNEMILAKVFVNSSGTEGYFYYIDMEKTLKRKDNLGEYYQVKMAGRDNFVPNFRNLVAKIGKYWSPSDKNKYKGNSTASAPSPSLLKVPTAITPVQAIEKFMGFIPLSEATSRNVKTIAQNNGWNPVKVSLYNVPDNVYVWAGEKYPGTPIKLCNGYLNQSSIWYNADGSIPHYFYYIYYPVSQFTKKQAYNYFLQIKQQLINAGYAFKLTDNSSYRASRGGKIVELDFLDNSKASTGEKHYRVSLSINLNK